MQWVSKIAWLDVLAPQLVPESYVGNAFLGQCNFLVKRHFEMGHLTRGGSSQAGCSCGGKKKGKSHVAMRRGFLQQLQSPRTPGESASGDRRYE